MADPALRIFPDEFLPSIQGSSYHSKWLAANPFEAVKWAKFRDAVLAGRQLVPPGMSSKYGKALIAAGSGHMSITRIVGAMTSPGIPIPPDPTVPPDPSVPPPPVVSPPPTGAQGGKHVSSVHQQDYLPSVMQYGLGDLLFVGEWAARQANIDYTIPVYAYSSAVNARSEFFTGLTPAEARNGGWILKDVAGSELSVTGFGGVACDIGSASFQQAWLNKVISQHRDTDGAQGTFIDDLAQSSHIISGTPALYPDRASWRAAVVEFASVVGPGLQAAGLKVMLNAGAWYPGNPDFDNGVSSIDWGTTLGAFGTSAMIELGFQTIDGTDTIRVMGSNWNQLWDKWGPVITAIEAAGIDYIGLAHAPGGDSAQAVYLKASMMLYMNRPGSSCMFNCHDSGGISPFGTKIRADLGAPLGDATLSVQTWSRSFASGYVWVNPFNRTADIVPN